MTLDKTLPFANVFTQGIIKGSLFRGPAKHINFNVSLECPPGVDGDKTATSDIDPGTPSQLISRADDTTRPTNCRTESRIMKPLTSSCFQHPPKMLYAMNVFVHIPSRNKFSLIAVTATLDNSGNLHKSKMATGRYAKELIF